MNKNIILSVMCCSLLVACGPKKQEENKEENKITQSVPQGAEKKHEEKLSPEQEEQLEINEDNVMDVVPG